LEIVTAFLALLAGFATIAVLVALITAVLVRVFPAWVGVPNPPHASYVLVNLVYSFLAAAAGGYVTAWMAVHNPLHTVLTLALVALVMGALSALQARGRQPAFYQVALLVVGALGVMAGGLLRLKIAGLL
jgi:hypothetical protein